MTKSTTNFLGKFLSKKIVSLLLVIALIGGAIGGHDYLDSFTGTIKETKALEYNCSVGSWNGVGCVVSYSCPNGGDLSGGTCNASSSNPVNMNDGCWGGGNFNPANTQGTITDPSTGQSYPVAGANVDRCLTFYPPSNSSTVAILIGLGTVNPGGYLPGIRIGSYIYNATPTYNNSGITVQPREGDIVPMGCKPVFAPQPTTCKYAVTQGGTIYPLSFSSFIGQIQVPNSILYTFFSSDIINVDNAASTFEITNIPTFGASPGLAQITNFTLYGNWFGNGSYGYIPVTNTAGNSVFIKSISSIVCDNLTPIANSEIVCTLNATSGGFFPPPYNGSATLSVNNTGGGNVTCNWVDSNITACPLVNVGSVTGPKTVTTNIGGTANITVIPATTPLTTTDIPGLIVICTTSPVNSTTTCTFTLPSNKTLPTDFKLSIGTGNPGGTCTATGSSVSCVSVPTGNSVGNIQVFGQFTSTVGSKTPTGENVAITGSNFGAINWNFNPDQGSTSPLFRSSDNTSITINNLRTIFDPTPNNDNRYTCTLEYRNFNDRNTTGTTTGLPWLPLDNSIVTPIPYITTSGTTQGCTVNLTKTQRGNVLNQSLRLTITDTSITTPSTSNPNTYTFYNEYLFRFQGAGVASGG